jgi:hypothetical protein
VLLVLLLSEEVLQSRWRLVSADSSSWFPEHEKTAAKLLRCCSLQLP